MIFHLGKLAFNKFARAYKRMGGAELRYLIDLIGWLCTAPALILVDSGCEGRGDLMFEYGQRALQVLTKHFPEMVMVLLSAFVKLAQKDMEYKELTIKEIL